jgi:hypothetical protein
LDAERRSGTCWYRDHQQRRQVLVLFGASFLHSASCMLEGCDVWLWPSAAAPLGYNVSTLVWTHGIITVNAALGVTQTFNWSVFVQHGVCATLVCAQEPCQPY